MIGFLALVPTVRYCASLGYFFSFLIQSLPSLPHFKRGRRHVWTLHFIGSLPSNLHIHGNYEQFEFLRERRAHRGPEEGATSEIEESRQRPGDDRMATSKGSD